MASNTDHSQQCSDCGCYDEKVFSAECYMLQLHVAVAIHFDMKEGKYTYICI